MIIILVHDYIPVESAIETIIVNIAIYSIVCGNNANNLDAASIKSDKKESKFYCLLVKCLYVF